MTRCSYARNTFIPKILKHVSKVVKIKKLVFYIVNHAVFGLDFVGNTLLYLKNSLGNWLQIFFSISFLIFLCFLLQFIQRNSPKKSQDLVCYLCSTCRKELTIQRNQNPELLALWYKIIFHCHNRPCIRTSETLLEEH